MSDTILMLLVFVLGLVLGAGGLLLWCVITDDRPQDPFDW
jgi:hypothetical protein